MPPSPNTTSGPNTGSATTPTSTSTPPRSIGWTRTPVSLSPNAAARSWYAADTSSVLRRSSRTAPASVLCTRPSACALSTTGPPSELAAAIASCSVRASTVVTCGIW